MKKLIFSLLIVLVSSAIILAQDTTGISLKQNLASSPQFTKAELLAFNTLQELLAAINNGKDYSKHAVRNFNLTATIINPDGTTAKLSEMGPGGKWSGKQKSMIEKFAQKGVSFTLENIRMVENGKKGMVDQPSVSFSIKE